MMVLFIEDDDEDGVLLQKSLYPYGFRFNRYRGVGEIPEGLDRTVILTDLNLPDSQGEDTLKRLRSKFPDWPIVVLSGLAEASFAEKYNAVFYSKPDFVNRKTIRDSLVGAIQRSLQFEKTKTILDRLDVILEKIDRLDSE